MKALLPLLYLMALVMVLSACNGDEPSPCPEVIQPPIQELNKWEKQRFPYGEFDTLVFVIEEPEIGRQDTVKLGRIHYDSSVVNHGDSTITESRCKKAFTSRTQLFTAMYGADYKDRLIFENDKYSERLRVRWDERSTGRTHNSFDQHYGAKNEKEFTDKDTAIINQRVFYEIFKDFRGIGGDFIYNIQYGFIFINDNIIDKKWFLLEAY